MVVEVVEEELWLHWWIVVVVEGEAGLLLACTGDHTMLVVGDEEISRVSVVSSSILLCFSPYVDRFSSPCNYWRIFNYTAASADCILLQRGHPSPRGWLLGMVVVTNIIDWCLE